MSGKITDKELSPGLVKKINDLNYPIMTLTETISTLNLQMGEKVNKISYISRPVLTGGWITGFNGYPSLRIWKDDLANINLYGAIKDGIVGTIAMLPTEYTPSGSIVLTVQAMNPSSVWESKQIVIDSTGKVETLADIGVPHFISVMYRN